MSSLVSLQCT
uniref:Uncharacterized protein n=1 Tax=Anguilla anguilla TaxID=7936 RepID=A0A0E9W1S0_ANGAN